MSITYEWEITGLSTKTEGSNIDSVIEANWIKRGIDNDGNSGEFLGTTSLTSVGSSNFIAFSSLTEASVLSWVQATLDTEESNYINSIIQEQIDLVSNPAEDKDLPWV